MRWSNDEGTHACLALALLIKARSLSDEWLESANKELHTEVLISQATFEALPENERQRIANLGPPRTLSIKGKQEPLQVYSGV
jgi:hypothetical protein